MHLNFLKVHLAFLLLNLCKLNSFSPKKVHTCGKKLNNFLMKWSIGKRKGAGPVGGGGMPFADQKIVGAENELYYHPSKVAKLTGVSADSIGKMKTIPLLPYNNNLVPYGTEWIHVFEMRYRQMMQDIGDGTFGFIYYSQVQLQKIKINKKPYLKFKLII